MAFFSKLKERLFKSQKKLDEGLDALVEDGGEVEAVAEPPQTTARPPEPAPEVRHPAPEPLPVAESEPEPEPHPEPEPVAASAEEVSRPSFLARAFGAKPKKTRVLDDEMLESLEEVLIQADMGVETALALSARLSESHYGKRVGTDDLKRLLADEISEILRPVAHHQHDLGALGVDRQGPGDG
ncbi:MAG: signal recognition particle receptor subunit alpha, partial [Pseudomonadota bacterium]